MPTHYETLGVKPDVGMAELKTAFRVLAKKWHPDVSRELTATDKFKEISLAYEILSDPTKRAQYDFSLRRPEQPQNDLVSTVFSDFEDMFKSKPKRKKKKKHPTAHVEIDEIPDDVMEDDSAGGIF